MNNGAGIDVSKGKSTVSVLRPFGEVVAKPFSVCHTGSELKDLADYPSPFSPDTEYWQNHWARVCTSMLSRILESVIKDVNILRHFL